jgi:hypothetical protein
MKPSFALNFTEDGITLLHRAKRGWLEVGNTSFDTPDLAEAIGYMRTTALGLVPAGITTKLVIPRSQILYTEVEAPGPDAAKRRAQIRAALEGRTPYDVDDLVFDWSGKGPTVLVAVVAKETLAEAEAFAVEHRLNPLSFVAIPDGDAFRSEPFFGTTAHSETYLEPGTKVDRDQDPISILNRDQPKPDVTVDQEPQPEPAPAEVPTPPEEAPQPAPEAPEVPNEAPKAPDEAPVPAPLETPAPDLPVKPEIEPAPEPQPDPVPTPAPEPLPVPEPAPEVEPPVEPETVPLPEPFDLPGFDPVQQPSVSFDKLPNPVGFKPTETAAPDIDDEAPMAIDVPDDDASDTTRPPIGASVTDMGPAGDDLPAAPATPIRVAFATRRGGGDLPAGRNLGGASKTDSTAPSVPISADKASADKAAGEKPAPAPRPAPKLGYETPPTLRSGFRDSAAASGKALRGLGALVTAPSIPGARSKKVQAQPSAPAAIAAKAQTQAPIRPVVKGGNAFGTRPLPTRGKPRYLGLILTGVLLLILAAAAALSSYFITSQSDMGTPEVQQAEALAPVAPAPVDVAVPDVNDEMLADMQDPADYPPQDTAVENTDATLPTDAANDAAVTETAADPVAESPATAALEPAPGVNAVTVLSEDVMGPTGEQQDEIFLASTDMAPVASDPLSLPLPASNADPQPTAQMPPPPFGTVYQFDADGRIRPTPEGITTPEGVLLVAGKPPLVPSERPAGLTAAPVSAPADDAVAAATPAPVDPVLLKARPRLRPAGLAPVATDAPSPDQTSLAPPVDSRLAGFRPAARPAALTKAPETAGNLGSLALVEPSGPTSALSLAVSPRPATRPADMSRAVEAAIADAMSAPTDLPPEAEAEPELLASFVPSIPTKANVAKEATVKNAINLSKLNLIGVYGTQSARYALVRQPNGRYEKVRVGDRLDGGKVAAITASEVRYEKRGQLLVLALPKG